MTSCATCGDWSQGQAVDEAARPSRPGSFFRWREHEPGSKMLAFATQLRAGSVNILIRIPEILYVDLDAGTDIESCSPITTR